tara:strand:+ start:55 stop:1365 length:1311 start_codon:yes stop_codon:yes gene_type:complete
MLHHPPNVFYPPPGGVHYGGPRAGPVDLLQESIANTPSPEAKGSIVAGKVTIPQNTSSPMGGVPTSGDGSSEEWVKRVHKLKDNKNALRPVGPTVCGHPAKTDTPGTTHFITPDFMNVLSSKEPHAPSIPLMTAVTESLDANTPNWYYNWFEANNIWKPLKGNDTDSDNSDSVSIGQDSIGLAQASIEFQLTTPPDSYQKRYITDYMSKMWNVEIKNYKSYVTALTHKSSNLNIQGTDDINNNERLEFLGDSVLQIIITEYLFHKFPKNSEGFLTKVRMKLINGKTLAEIGRKLKMEKMIRTGTRIKTINKKLIEDAFEALVCVIYQEHGLDYTKQILINLYEKYINFDEIIIDSNYKEILLKYSQKQKDSSLEYILVDELGPSHSKLFRVQVKFNGKIMGVGCGSTRKEAEQQSARETITILGLHPKGGHGIIDD